MCVNYKLCVKLHKGPFAFSMEKFPSLEKFYTHAVTGVTDNYQVCTPLALSSTILDPNNLDKKPKLD